MTADSSKLKTVRYQLLDTSEWLQGVLVESNKRNYVYSMQGELVEGAVNCRPFPIFMEDICVDFEDGRLVIKLKPLKDNHMSNHPSWRYTSGTIYSQIGANCGLSLQQESYKYGDPSNYEVRMLRLTIFEQAIDHIWFDMKVWEAYVRIIYYHNLTTEGEVFKIPVNQRIHFNNPASKYKDAPVLEASELIPNADFTIDANIFYFIKDSEKYPVIFHDYYAEVVGLGITSESSYSLLRDSGITLNNIITVADCDYTKSYALDFLASHVLQLAHIMSVPYDNMRRKLKSLRNLLIKG